MTEDRMTTMFFEMFTGLPRQGPGDTASTLRALSLVPGIGPHTRVLNPGCGTGLEARVIAQNAPVRIVAIDNHQQYVEEFNREAEALALVGLSRVAFRDGDYERVRLVEGVGAVKGKGGARARSPGARWRRAASVRASPKLEAGRLFASSASPHHGPDSAVLSPKQRTSRQLSARQHLYVGSRGPAAGFPVR